MSINITKVLENSFLIILGEKMSINITKVIVVSIILFSAVSQASDSLGSLSNEEWRRLATYLSEATDLSEIVQTANAVDADSSINSKQNIIGVLFLFFDNDDPWVKVWGNSLHPKIQTQVKAGIKYIEEEYGNVSYSDLIPKKEDSEAFYINFNKADEKARRGLLKETAEKYGVTGLVFGKYSGDGYEVTYNLYFYDSFKDTVSKGEKARFTRHHPEYESPIAYLSNSAFMAADMVLIGLGHSQGLRK